MLQVCCLLMSNLSVPTSSLAVFFCSFKHTCTHPVCQAEARRKARGNPDLVALLEQLADVGSGIPDAPSEAVLCEIILEAQKALHEDHWKTCAVCDEEKPSIALPGQGTLFHMLLPSELPPRANTVLQPEANHTYSDELLGQYNVANMFSRPADQAILKPLLLSPRGVEEMEPGSIEPLRICLCDSCYTSLISGKELKPPKLAIANGFVIGQLPEHLRPQRLEDPNDQGSSILEFDLIRPIYMGGTETQTCAHTNQVPFFFASPHTHAHTGSTTTTTNTHTVGGWILVCTPYGKGTVRRAENVDQDEKYHACQRGISGHWLDPSLSAYACWR